jgi:hypothetical protein
MALSQLVIQTMDIPKEGLSSDTNTPDTENQRQHLPMSLEDMVRELATRQQATEANLQAAEAAVHYAESSKRTLQKQHDEQMSTLMTALKDLIMKTAPKELESRTYAMGPQEWKPPSWEGKTGTFRDYLFRIQSSYNARSGMKPTLSNVYYWDTINDLLPYAKCEGPSLRHGPVIWLAGELSRTARIFQNSKNLPEQQESSRTIE